MSSIRSSRRDFIRSAAAGASVAVLPMPAIAQNSGGRAVVVGGGFAGATCARTLKKLSPRANITLVEASPTFTACPFSNDVIAGLREITAQQFGYQDGVNEGANDRVADAQQRAFFVFQTRNSRTRCPNGPTYLRS